MQFRVTLYHSTTTTPYLRFFFSLRPPPLPCTLFPYPTLFRSAGPDRRPRLCHGGAISGIGDPQGTPPVRNGFEREILRRTKSEEHTSELQSQFHLVCRLLLEKKTTLI